MRSRRWRAALFMVALTLSTQRAAVADEPGQPADVRGASRSFNEGERAFRAGDYTRAGDAFERAYALAPHADALWNAARAWHRADEKTRAANLYARYLKEAPPGAPDRNSATAALVQLSARLGRLEVLAAGTSGITIDERAVEGEHDDRARTWTVFVTPGRHVVRGRRGETAVEETVAVGAGEVVSVAFDRPASEAPAPSPSPSPPPSPAPPPPPAERRAGVSPAVVWIGAGVTLAVAGITTWSGLDTLAERDAFLASPSQEELDRGRDKQLRTNVLLGATGALAALTAPVSYTHLTLPTN